jgi:2-C-methyl-D-erythritol 2,4-cyclodiphosphate synthase
VRVKSGIGIDSHRFLDESDRKPLVLGGLRVGGVPGLAGNSDADVVLHALTDAISGVTGETVIGAPADAMCAQGLTDSRLYLACALESLGVWSITHVSIAIECKRPKIDPFVPQMRQSIAGLLSIPSADVCITATSGEALSDVGRGLGIFATVIVTVCESD